MIIIKINRSSIKLNPKAGQTCSKVQGNRTATFSFKGKLPKELAEKCEITMEHLDGSGCFGIIKNPYDINQFIEYNGMKVDVESGIETIYHMPLSKWLYEYEVTMLTCNNCAQIVSHKEIEIDYSDDGSSHWVSCPRCNGVNSFPEFEFEDITDVLKEQNF